MQKNAIYVIMIIITLIFTITTCSTTSGSSGGFYNQNLGMSDRYLTEEQSCILEIAGVLRVYAFNGSSVNWVNRWIYGDEVNRSLLGKSFIRIPAGRHELIASYLTKSSNIAEYSANDLRISFNFLAGRTYRLDAILSTQYGESVNNPVNAMIGTSFNIRSIGLRIIEIASTAPKIDESLGLIRDRRLDGTWQFTKDPIYKIVFFGETWRLLKDDKILKDDGGITLAGVFFLFQDEIHLAVVNNQGIPIEYKFSRNTLTFNNVQFLTWMAGRWNKINSGREASESNPLVGTWKAITNNGNVNILQFDPTFTVRNYIYNKPGYIDNNYSYNYFYDSITNSGTFESSNIKLVYNTDELIIDDIIYKRE